MKNFTLLISLLLGSSAGTFAQFWQPTGAKAASGSAYLVAADHVGDNIYAVGFDQGFVHSSDRGLTWSTAVLNPPGGTGTIVSLRGTATKLYAQVKIANSTFATYFSSDHGATWTVDTVGLTRNSNNTGTTSFQLTHMGGDYLIANSNTKTFVKHVNDPSWTSTYIDFTVIDVLPHGSTWLAIGAQKILKSTNLGVSWSQMTTAGLPPNFQGYNLASNQSGRLFVSNAPADGGESIYFSSDNGANWTLTNSAGHFTYNNPWIGEMYAVDDYLFAAVTPEFANFQDPPPYLVSSQTTPNFAIGDSTGLPFGSTSGILPFFFHIGDQLYTMFGDIYTAQPGFTGTSSLQEKELSSFDLFPNPSNSAITLSSSVQANYAITNLNGSELLTGEVDGATKISVDHLPSGVYLVTVQSEQNAVTKRFIKE